MKRLHNLIHLKEPNMRRALHIPITPCSPSRLIANQGPNSVLYIILARRMRESGNWDRKYDDFISLQTIRRFSHNVTKHKDNL